MVDLNLPKGLIVDLITPLEENGAIDGRGLGRHLDLLIPHVEGILISGPSTGEGSRLSTEQRIDLFDKTLVVVRGNIPVLVWITGKTPEDTVEILDGLKKQKETRKYDGSVFWVDTPLYYHSNRGLPEYYKDLCSQHKEPLILHNDPGLIQSLDKPLKRKNVRTSILKELAMNDNIKGMIFSGSLDRLYNYRKAVRSRSEFKIYDGDESRFLDYPGHSGLISKGANIAYREWSKITSSSLNLNSEDAYPDQQKQAYDTWSYLSSLKDIYSKSSVDIIKMVLEKKGIINGPVNSKDDDVLGSVKQISEIMGL